VLVEGRTVLGSYPAEALRHVRDRHFIDKTEMAMWCRGVVGWEVGMKCFGVVYG